MTALGNILGRFFHVQNFLVFSLVFCFLFRYGGFFKGLGQEMV